MHLACLVNVEARRGHWSLYCWAYKWLWAAMLLMGIESNPGPSVETANDPWAIALAFSCLAAPGNSEVLLNLKGVLAEFCPRDGVRLPSRSPIRDLAMLLHITDTVLAQISKCAPLRQVLNSEVLCLSPHLWWDDRRWLSLQLPRFHFNYDHFFSFEKCSIGM